MENRIFLRGISRTPSDRMTADGGCAESINVVTEDGEVAPVPGPGQVGVAMQDRALYIHKTTDYTNYIVRSGDAIGMRRRSDSSFNTILTLESGEKLVQVQSIGNTVMVLTDRRMFYALYKGGEYHPLGDHVPEAHIKVRKQHFDQVHKDRKVTINATSAQLIDLIGQTYTHQDIQTSIYRERLDEIFGIIADSVRSARSADLAEMRRNNYLLLPVMVRYAVRLYDGSSYVNHSAPIYIDPDDFTKGPLECVSVFHPVSGDKGYVYDKDWQLGGDGKMEAYKPYQLKFEITNASDFDGWEDIVAGVDIFSTQQFDMENWKLYATENVSIPNNYLARVYLDRLDAEGIEKRLEAQNDFRLIRAIDIAEYSEMTGEFGLESYDIYGDALLAQKRLPTDVTFSHRKTIPNGLHVFNGRLMIVGSRVKYYDGYYNHASIWKKSTGVATEDYAKYIKFFFRSAGGMECVVMKEYSNLEDRYIQGPWLFYPEPTCYKAEVWYYCSGYNAKVVTLTMKEHPFLQGAYCFTGFGDGGYIGDAVTKQSYDLTVNDEADNGNVLQQSETDRPFFFPISQTFVGKLTAVAVITEALSTGQYGYASLYAFTEEGIKTMKIDADGTISNIDSLSMDVALPGTVCQLNQSIAFTTERGLMLLAGSRIQCLSDKMRGKPYTLEDEVSTMLTDSMWDDMKAAVDGMAFQDYLAGAVTVNDSVNGRLVCFRDDKDYAYSYMAANDTWQKIWLDGYRFCNTLNSYPQAYVTMQKGSSYYIMDFAVRRDVSATEKTRFLIATRPFSMDRDDVRKAIVDLRIRGAYSRSNVKYILLASMDGMTFRVLHSLRGGSYKVFRMVMVGDIGPTERISWIDLDYETRFDTRLR